MKKKPVPTEKTRVRVELLFVVEVSVQDPDDMVEICTQTVKKFREGIWKHEISVVEAMVKTELC